MKKCYIHIGVHKTGTTSIQMLLGKHRAALRKHGISVPVAGNAWSPDVGYHHNIAFELNGDSRYVPGKGGLAELFRELEQESCPTVVISSEDLCFTMRDEAKLSRLRNPLVAMGYQVEWIIYFRTYPEWAESAYIELAKALGVARTFDYWARHGASSLVAGVDPAGILAEIHKTGDALHVHSYAMAGKDVTRHFFDLIRAPQGLLSSMPEKKRANSRLTVFEVEFLRYLAVFKIRHVPLVKRQELADECRKWMRNLPPGPAFCGLSNETARHLYESTRSNYEALLRDYRPDCTMEEFFPLAPSYEPVTLDNCGAGAGDCLALYRLVSDIIFNGKYVPRLPAS